jgi:hypothetical protein
MIDSPQTDALLSAVNEPRARSLPTRTRTPCRIGLSIQYMLRKDQSYTGDKGCWQTVLESPAPSALCLAQSHKRLVAQSQKDASWVIELPSHTHLNRVYLATDEPFERSQGKRAPFIECCTPPCAVADCFAKSWNDRILPVYLSLRPSFWYLLLNLLD